MQGPAHELQRIVGAELVSVTHDPASGWMTLRFDRGEDTWFWDITLAAARPLEQAPTGKEAPSGA